MIDLDPETDLSFTRVLAVPRACDLGLLDPSPTHIRHFFMPAPHKVMACDIDLRVGGRFNTSFDVDGTVMDNKGCIWSVIAGKKLVFTDTLYRRVEART